MAIDPITNGDVSARAKLNAAIAKANLVDNKADASALTAGLADEAMARIAGDNAALAHADTLLTLVIPAVGGRPGDAPDAFTTSLAGGSLDALPGLPLSAIITNDAGAAHVLAGPSICAPRAYHVIEPGRLYRVRGSFQRLTDSPDPANDAVRLGIAWYDQNKMALVPAKAEVKTWSGIVKTAGLNQGVAVVSRAAGVNVEVIAPPTARYARPYIETFGDSRCRTLVYTIDWIDVTDSRLWSPHVADFDARLTAELSLDLGPRVDVLETEVATPVGLRIPSLADLEATTISASPDAVEVLGFPMPALGRHKRIRGVLKPAARQAADGSWWELDETVVRLEAVRDLLAPVDTAIALREAAEYLADRFEQGVIEVGPAEYIMTAHPDIAVGTNEGVGLLLIAGMRNLLLRGQGGRTVLRPASNRVEMILQREAENVAIEGIIFDNRLNGALQNQVKVVNITPGGGVAACGNVTNSAIRQSKGANLSVRRCSFYEFTSAVQYFGNIDNDQELVGTLDSESNFFKGCAQGHLLFQPREFIANRIRSEDGVDSINAGGSLDQGHLVYVSAREGAAPEQVNISQVLARNDSSSPLKVRKADRCVIEAVTSWRCGRGIELSNCRAGSLSDFSISLKPYAPVDTSQAALELVDTGAVVVGNGVIDVRGANAWGARIRKDIATSAPADAWKNHDWRLHGVTILNDFSGGTGKAPIVAVDQHNFEIDDVTFRHPGSVTNDRYPVQIVGGSGGRIGNIRHIAPELPTDGHRLVHIDPGGTGHCVMTRELDTALPYVRSTGNIGSIYDQGTGTRISVVGPVRTELLFSPTITFATPGDLSVAYAVQGGLAVVDNGRVNFDLRLVFTPSGTYSGNFRIGLPGLPVSRSLSSIGYYSVQGGAYGRFDYQAGQNEILPVVVAGQTYVQLHLTRDDNTLGVANAVNIPAGEEYTIQISGSYPI